MKGNIKPWPAVRQRCMTAYNRKAFGKNIQTAREMKGLSQSRLAEILRVGRNFVCNWESGFSRPDFKMIPEICRVLNMPIQSFYGWPCSKTDMQQEEILFLRDYMDLDGEDQKLISSVMRQMLTLELNAAHDLCRKNFVKVPQYDSEDYFRERHGNHLRWIRRRREQKKPDFLVTLSGSGLSPYYDDNDELVGRRTGEIADGQFGLVLVDEDLAVLRRTGDVMTGGAGTEQVPYSDRSRMEIVGVITGRLEPKDFPDENERLLLGNVLRGAG